MDNDLVEVLEEETEGVFEDRQQSFRIPFKHLDFIVFFGNTFLIWYELNTGFKYILNEKYNAVRHVLNSCQTWNAILFLRIVFTIGANISLKYNYFGKTKIYFGCVLSVLSFLTSHAYWSAYRYSLDGQMSDDSRLQIGCTQLIVSQIGLIGLIYFNE